MEGYRETEPAPERTTATTKPLHNFPMNTWLKWGNQRYLRCVKVDSPENKQKEPEADVAMEEDEDEGEGSGSTRPWNLRTRRTEGQSGDKIGIKSPPRQQQQQTESFTPTKSLRLRGTGNSNNCNGERESGKERPKFSLTLTKKEIEEDFLRMTGEKPPRRTKKRPKAVQKQLDMAFPGVWMREVNADMYKVSELPDGRAKRQ